MRFTLSEITFLELILKSILRDAMIAGSLLAVDVSFELFKISISSFEYYAGNGVIRIFNLERFNNINVIVLLLDFIIVSRINMNDRVSIDSCDVRDCVENVKIDSDTGVSGYLA